MSKIFAQKTIQINKLLAKTNLLKHKQSFSGFNITPDAGTSLRKITKFGLDDKLPSFEIISIGANKELQLQNDLAAMIKEWENVVFPICTYKDTNIRILSNLDDIQV